MAQLRIVTGSGVVQMTDTRETLCLLGKGGSPPAGTVFTAKGASTDYHFGYAPGGSSYGLTTRDAAGQVLFDAVTYGRMAKPVGVMTGSIQNVETETKQQTFPGGRDYAVWVANTVSSIRPRGGSGTIGGVMNYWYHLDRQYLDVNISGATVTITAWRELDPNQQGVGVSAPYEGGGKYDWTAVVLDVTHY